MKRPYIPLGVDGQGRVLPTLLARARTAVARHVIDDDPTDGPPDAATRPSPLHPITQTFDWGRPTLMYACIAVLAIVLLALGGCGGGSDLDEPDATTQPVDCKATPDRCA